MEPRAILNMARELVKEAESIQAKSEEIMKEIIEESDPTYPYNIFLDLRGVERQAEKKMEESFKELLKKYKII